MRRECICVENERIRPLIWMGDGPRPADAIVGNGVIVSAGEMAKLLGLSIGDRVVKFGLLGDTVSIGDMVPVCVEYTDDIESDLPVFVG